MLRLGDVVITLFRYSRIIITIAIDSQLLDKGKDPCLAVDGLVKAGVLFFKAY